jgi:hypothetical protein
VIVAHFIDSWDASRHLGYLYPGNVLPTDDLVTHGPSVPDALTSRPVEPLSGRTAECRPRFHESIKWAASAHAVEVKFITERHNGLKPEQAAYRATGRNRVTGKLTLGIGIGKRRNGLVHFDGDLWRLDLDLHPDAIGRLYRHWQDLNADCSLPKRILRGMDCHFSRTTIVFDATAEQVEEWKDFLRAILSDARSYIEVDGFVARRNASALTSG